MSPTPFTIASLLDTLGRVPLLVGALTKGTLLVLIALCLTRLFGRAPAAARHLVWSLAVGGLLLLPATKWIPWQLELSALTTVREALDGTPALPSSAREQRSTADHAPGTTALPNTAELGSLDVATSVQRDSRYSTSRSSSSVSPFADRLRDPAAVVMLAWIAGMVWMLGRLIVGVTNVRRIVRQSVPLVGDGWESLLDETSTALGARTDARVVISAEAAMPFTCGLVHPVIVLPDSAEDWSSDRRRSVLLHELAHVRRRDLLTNALVQLACVVYWFHPLVRLAARRVRLESERACDALVVAAGTRPSDYAGDLLEIARNMRSSATAAVALALARRSDFEGRLLAILAPDAGRNVLTAARAVLVALSFAAPAVAIAAAVPARHTTPDAPPDAAPATSLAQAPAPAVRSTEPLAPPAMRTATEAGLPQAPATTPGQRGDTAVPALLSVLSDENAAVRLAAVESLGHLSDPRAVDALVQALRTDTDARVREAAAQALGDIDSPRAVPGLIAALGAERVPAVRAKIAWALGEIDDTRAVDALSAVVRDPEVEVRRQAVWALGELGSPAAVRVLIPALQDADVETQKQAAAALGELESPDAIDALSAATKSPEAEVRKEAVSALGQIEDKRALPALEAATRDRDVEVRRAAVEAIGDLDDVRSAPQALIAALRDDDAGVRKSAAEALGGFEDEAAVPALIPLTRDGVVEVKRAAVEALASIGGTRAVEVMAGLLKDDDPEIRKLAAEALGKRR